MKAERVVLITGAAGGIGVLTDLPVDGGLSASNGQPNLVR